MKSAHWKHALLGLAALVILSFLYAKTQEIDANTHNQILDRISHFKQVNALLNQQILEIRQGLLPYYDPIVGNMAKLKDLQADITRMLANVCTNNPLLVSQRLQLVEQILSQKQQQLESFKSSNALQRNSLRYLPTATEQVANSAPANESGNQLRRSLATLLLNVLTYNATSGSDLISTIHANTDALRRDSQGFPPSLQADVSILMSHVDITLTNKVKTDALVQQLLSHPLTVGMDAVLDAYILEHDQMTAAVDRYRLALYGFSVFLLVIIGVILLRLRQTAATLQQSMADLRSQKYAMDQHAIVSITDKGGKIIYANKKFCDVSRYSNSELLGSNHRIVKSSRHNADFYRDMWSTISRGDVWHGQICNRAKNGGEYWVDTTITPSLDHQGKPFQYIAIRTDITEIKQAQEQLRIQAAALEAAANGVVITNRRGEIQWANTAFCSMTGYSQDEVVALSPNLLRSDQQGAEFYQNLWETILSGQVWHGELLNQRKDGSLYTEEQSISPVLDENNEISHFIAIKQDVTEWRQTEEALRRSQKLDAIGQLTGGIAHDFNNRLGIIIGYLDFLKELFPAGEQPRQWVDTATRATQGCMDLTRQLLSFSRHKNSDKRLVSLNEALKGLRTMIAGSITPEVDMQYILADNLWPTKINPDEFQDAILNLVINARDAMPDGGKLQFEVNNCHLDSTDEAANPGIEAGDYVQLTLTDTGSGIDKETLERVFEPFFTTKAEGKGTGLGLAMVYAFIKRSHGSIIIDSMPHVGTTVRLYLPRAKTDEQVIQQQILRDEDLPKGHESILVVDDEADLLQLACHYLTDLGYQTQKASHAAQALDRLRNGETFDLMFSDVVMPGEMNGYELAQQATRIQPGLKVLLTSGFTSKTISDNGLAGFAEHLLDKPYRKADLAQRIRRVLDAGPVAHTEADDMNSRPQTPSSTPQQGLAVPPPSQPAGKDVLIGRRILVVDDEEDIRDLFALHLEKLGCTTSSARTGDEAIERYRQALNSGTPFDIVILDLSLPGSLGGKEVAQDIRRHDPHARLIVASGHTEGPEMSHCQDYGFDAALEKNFNRKNIQRVLEQVLSAS